MTFNSIERLGVPFAGVSEVGFTIPAGGDVALRNPERKIVFFLQASCLAEIDGIGRYEIRSGDVLVVPNACTQRYVANRRGHLPKVHALKIAFSLPPLAPLQPRRVRGTHRDPEDDLTSFVLHHLSEVRHLAGAQTAETQDTLRAIREEMEFHRPGVRHTVRSLAATLVVRIARRVHETAEPQRDATAPAQGPVVVQIKEYLGRNYARHLTLGEIAWQVRKSEEHAARVFRKITGQTIFDYLRAIRLEHAKTHLINSNHTVTEIARLTGFGSLALFSRRFSQYVGRSPSAYRDERARLVTWRAP